MSAVEKIERQQAKEKGRTAAWMVGEQLKDMARREPESAELLDKDLDIPEMSIQQAEKKIKAYADAHKTGSFACVTPAEAERILREFYGLNPSGEGALSVTASPCHLSQRERQERGAEIIDLGAFLGRSRKRRRRGCWTGSRRRSSTGGIISSTAPAGRRSH